MSNSVPATQPSPLNAQDLGHTCAIPARSPFLLRTVRMRPRLYSAICRARLFYSRRIAGAKSHRAFLQNRALFSPSQLETQPVHSLKKQGYALISAFFPVALIDRIYAKADSLFRSLAIDCARAYSVQTGERPSLEGASYEDLAATEKVIILRDPLVQIPELVDIAFNESIVRIAANFLGCVPPLYRVTLVRDFPHEQPLHSSNFHKDNDETDSLQIFIYLVDIDDTRGPLVYVPGSNRYDVRSCRPRLSRDLGLAGSSGRFSDEEIERVYPRSEWATLRTVRGSIAMIHGNGIHKGPSWTHPGDPANKPRTAIKLDLHGCKSGVVRNGKENHMRRSDLERLAPLQKLFAHATTVDDAIAMLAHAGH
ncbi:MAG: phytanoyl-CoA dioxygenase family protein [Candidatus Acidiferrales bacterium]